MSYTIMYGKQFVKCEHGIIPMVLMGSNNCTMFHRGKEIKERYWESYFATSKEMKVAFSEEEIMQKVYSWLPSSYGEWFKFRGKWVDDDGVVRFFKNGIKNARTIEEIIADNRGQDLTCKISYWIEHNHEAIEYACVRTTADLDAWIDRAEQKKAELVKDNNNEVYFSLKFWGIEPLKAPIQDRAIQGEVVAKYKGQYITSINQKGGGIAYNNGCTGDDAIVFKNIAEAKKFIRSYFLCDIKFVSADNLIAKLSEQQYCITYKTDYGEHYIKRVTSRHLFYASSMKQAQRFTLKNAQKWIEKQSKRDWQTKGTFEIKAMA